MSFTYNREPNSAQLIARSLGTAANKGLQNVLGEYQKGKDFEKAGLPREWATLPPELLKYNLQKFDQINKNRKSLPTAFSSYSKSFNFDKSISDTTRRKLLREAEGLVDQGYDPLGAINSVYDNYLSEQETRGQEKEPEKERFNIAKSLLGPLGSTEELGNFFKERETPEGPTRLQSLLSAGPKGLIEGARSINPFSSENIAHLITGTPQQTPQAIEQALPTQDKAAERLLRTGGRVAPLAALGGGSIPAMLLEIGGAAAGREVAKQLGAGENVQSLAEAFGFGLPALSKLAFSKIGQVLKGKNLQPPKIKEIGYKPKAEVPPASGPEVAQEMMDSYSNIVNDAVKNLEGRGITLEAINNGEPKALAELQKEANKAANLYKDADKLNLKAFEKQRADIAKKLPESPLEKYYPPEKPSTKRPDTIAKEAERNKPLETIVKQNERRARDLQYQILSADQEIRAGTMKPAEVERVIATRRANELAHQKAMNEIKNARFEMKYGRPPATSEQIQTQIDKTFNELREGIKTPTAKKVEDFKKGFERDKHLIDDANKLIARGEIPGPEIFDEYIKVHEQYLKNYKDLSKELTDYIKENKAKPRFGPKVKRAEELKELIDNTQKLTDAKLALQKDKRRVQGVLQKPSGAFYKQMLKDLRKDIDAFQKDFFKWSKIAEGTEAKTAEVAKKAIKPLPKVQEKAPKVEVEKGFEAGKQAAKNPNKENIKSAAERSGMSENEYKEYLKKISEKVKDGFKDIKSGKSSIKIENEVLKTFLDKWKKLPKLAKYGISGATFGTIQALSEEYLGFKPKMMGLRYLGIPTIYSGAAIANPVYRMIRDAFSEATADELKSKRGNPKEFDAYYKKLRDKYGDNRANKIRKSAIQS